MLKIRNGRLNRSALEKLTEYQAAVDGRPGYPASVDHAKAKFSSFNRVGNRTFDAVKAKLTDMCSGSRRCMYCEDSVADEVEHFHPKDLYPELVFVWENYLYACGPCNGPKNNRFSVVNAANNTLINVTRARGAPVVPPQAGSVALINPRNENPLDFLMLDLRGTFEFTPIDDVGTLDYERALYTIDILRLNERDYLIRARRNAYDGFCARLSNYILVRNRGASPRVLSLMKGSLRRTPHPTVWAEIKRQHHSHVELDNLFREAPEALEF